MTNEELIEQFTQEALDRTDLETELRGLLSARLADNHKYVEHPGSQEDQIKALTETVSVLIRLVAHL
jgi:hypothetical protein